MPGIVLDHRTVRRMAHFVPTTSTQSLATDAVDFIIVRTIAQDARPGLKIPDIVGAAEALFQLTLDPDEVGERLKALRQSKIIDWDTESGYYLTPSEKARMQNEAQESAQLENEVIENWLSDLSTTVAGELLSDEDKQCLREDILKYISLVYHVHGADCASFITRDGRFAEDLLRTEQENTLAQLPERDERFNKIRKIALPAFFQNGNAKRKAYLSGLLNSSFVLMVMSGDRTLASYWRENWRGTVFFLDTNFLLRVLNVQGSERFAAATRLIKLCHNAGIIVKVTNITIKELTDVLHYWRNVLESKRPPSTALAALAWKTPRWEASIVTAFYEHIATGGVASDFLNRFKLVERQLKAHGILVDSSDYFAILENDPKRPEFISKLMASTKKEYFDRAEHDALHRLLVERQRGGRVRDPLEAKVWFLTCDGRLAEYEHRRSIREDDVPTIISTSTWMQLVRPVLGRNYSDYDTTFMSMVTSPHLRAFDRITPTVAYEVVSRIQHYENMPPEVACMLMQNDYLCQKLASATPQEEEELINLEIAEALKEAKRQAEEERLLREQAEKNLQSAQQTTLEVEQALGIERRSFEESLAKKEHELKLAERQAQEKLESERLQQEQMLSEVQTRYTEVANDRDALLQAQARLEDALRVKELERQATEKKAREVEEALRRLKQERLRTAWRVRRILAVLVAVAIHVSALVIPWNAHSVWTRLAAILGLIILDVCLTVLAIGVDPLLEATWRRKRFRWFLVSIPTIGVTLATFGKILALDEYWNYVSIGFTLVGFILTVILAIRLPRDDEPVDSESKAA